MGINVDEVYASNYMNAAYVKAKPGSQLRLKIASADVQMFGEEDEGKKAKVVVHFEAEEKSLALNATNKNILKDTWGPDTDSWISKWVIVKVVRSAYMGKPVDSVQVEPVLAAGTSPQIPPRAVLGPAGAAKLTARLAETKREVGNLRNYLAQKHPQYESALASEPSAWPSDVGTDIAAWFARPEPAAEPVPSMSADDIPF